MTIEKMDKNENSFKFKNILKKQETNAKKTSEELDMKVPLNNRLKYQKENDKKDTIKQDEIVSIQDNTKEDKK